MNMTPIELIASAARDIQNLMERRLRSGNVHLKKSAILLAYWIRDYVRLLNHERSGGKTYRRYGRGDIVKVHLGFRIGNEEGGLHYGIVLDRRDTTKNPVLMILPMTSVKESTDLTRLNPKDVYLGNEVTDAIAAKIRKNVSNLSDEAVMAGKGFSDFKCKDEMDEEEAARFQKALQEINGKSKVIRSQIAQMSKMKRGGIALCNQMVTVSKLRIYDPCSSRDLLHGIHLSSASLDKIDEKIKELYLNH